MWHCCAAAQQLQVLEPGFDQAAVSAYVWCLCCAACLLHSYRLLLICCCVPPAYGAAVLLQQILEGAGLPFTGMTSDFAFKCSNRLTLSKVSTTQNRWRYGLH